MQIVTQGGVTLASETSTPEELNAALKSKDPQKNSSAAALGQAETDPESETGTPESEEQERAKGKGGFQRRIDRLTRERTQALDLAERERLARQRLESQLAGRPAGATDGRHANGDDPEPQQGQFPSWEAWNTAQARWAARQEYKAQRVNEARAEVEHAQNERLRGNLQAHTQRLNETREQYEDWDKVARALEGGGMIPQSAGLAMIELENGPEVMYHLAKNPELLAKLNKMSEVRAVAEIGRIGASLPSANPDEAYSPEPRPVSSLPAPIKPVGGSATKVSSDPTKMSLVEYNRWRDKGGGR